MIEAARNRSKGALYVLFTTTGVLGGLLARDAIEINQNPIVPVITSQGQSYDLERPLYEATIAADIHNALFPTPQPTTTPYPTATSSPDPTHDKNFCRPDTKVGDLCKIPYPPPPTPTPYPNCDNTTLTPGDWCIVKATPTV